MLHAGYSELKRAFQSHLEAFAKDRSSKSMLLLLFYAAECGLKWMWLVNNNLKTTSEMERLFPGRGHDLQAWVKVLGLSPRDVPRLPSIKLARDGSSISIELVHQAWRYGIGLVPLDEQAIESWLLAVCNRVKREH
jgi:hypothetical protein